MAKNQKINKNVLERLVKFDKILGFGISGNKKHIQNIENTEISEDHKAQLQYPFHSRLESYNYIRANLYELFPELKRYREQSQEATIK